MKKLSIAVVLLASLVIAGCGGKKNKTKVEYVSTLKQEANDSTVYGKCGEGTMMNTLELVTDSGDTVVYSIEEAAARGDVKGGLLAGDRMAVVPTLDADGNSAALSVVNITTLLGKWTCLDRSFELLADGSVHSNVKEPHPYTSWKLFNGKLLLSSDTFSICSLGSDSLLLSNGNGTVGYRRLASGTTGAVKR